MAITSFTIAGDEVNPLYDTLDIRETVGGVATLSCDVVSVGSPVQRFAVFDPVIVQEDGTTIFSGSITQVRERGLAGKPNLYSTTGAPEIVVTVTVEDHNRIAERVYVTETVADGTTLKAFLTTLVSTYFSQFSVTLHASQVDGPNLPAMTFDLARGNDVLNALADVSGFLWRIDYDKALRMWQAGDILAPFDIDEFDDPARWTDDVEVETILGDHYANRVTVISDPLEEEFHVETFTGDGVTSTFALTWQFIKDYGIIHVFESDGVTPAGGETFGVEGESPIQWEYDPDTNSITRLIGPTDATKVYKLTFHATFQAEATAEDSGEVAAHGLYEHVERVSNITDNAAALELAEAILAERLNATEAIVTYKTRWTAPGLHVGQQQTISATARNISGDFIVRDLRVIAETPATADFAAAGLGLLRTVTAKQQEVMVGKWQHTYRDWLRFGSGGGISVTTAGDGGPGGGGPAPPINSNQYHHPDGGKFGGHAHWTFDQDTTTVMVGTGHTPGGADNFLNGSGHTVI